MRLFLTMTIALMASTASEEDEIREMLDFIELNLLNLLQYGDYPAIYNSSYPRIEECGCYYSPKKIAWGNKIGLECQRGIPGVNVKALPEHDADKCGRLCNDMHGIDAVLFCPPGWTSSCEQGCEPNAEFATVKDRVDFWNATLSAFLLYGSDYIAIKGDHLKQCGCTSKARKIMYGSKIGFFCVMGEDSEALPGCSASSDCLDTDGRRIVTFCPAGHRATCDGCQINLNSTDDDLHGRLEWMTAVTSGIAQNSLSVLSWQPSLEQILGCACKANVEQITYGARVGIVCEIHGVDMIQDSCGPNILCMDDEGKDILHICPQGFKPDCKLGCATPISEKLEL